MVFFIMSKNIGGPLKWKKAISKFYLKEERCWRNRQRYRLQPGLWTKGSVWIHSRFTRQFLAREPYQRLGGGSNEGALNGISKYSSLPEIVNEKLLERKAPIDDDELFIFDVGHGSIRWVFAVMWFVIIVADNVNAWNFLLSFELQIWSSSKVDASNAVKKTCFSIAFLIYTVPWGTREQYKQAWELRDRG